jgi:hypothetical protein
MGRGLSPLQRWILQCASERGHLFIPEICEGFFGWQPITPLRRYGGDHPADQHRQPRLESGEQRGDFLPFVIGIRYFSRQEIGSHEYGRVMWTISRTLKRLEARGVVERWRFGPHISIAITDHGRQWLSGNTHDKVTSINR